MNVPENKTDIEPELISDIDPEEQEKTEERSWDNALDVDDMLEKVDSDEESVFSNTDEESVEKHLFSLPIDPQEGNKATKLNFLSFARPHMRAFHYGWWTIFIIYFSVFSIPPLLPAIENSLNLDDQQLWLTQIVGLFGDILCRIAMGPLSDQFGARILISILLIAGSIPVACVGFANSLVGLCILRFFLNCLLSAGVACLQWLNGMFTVEIQGTVSAVLYGIGCTGAGACQIVIGTLLFPLFRDVVYAEDNPDIAADKAWRSMLIFPGIALFFTGVLVCKTSEDTPMGNYKQLISSGNMKSVSPRTSLIESSTNYNTWLLFFQYACCAGAEATVMNGATRYFKDEFDLPLGSAAAIASIVGFTSIFASAGGICSDKADKEFGVRGRLWAQLLLNVLTGICIICFALMRTLWAAVLLLGVFACFCLAAEGTTFAIIPHVNKYYGGVAGIVGAGASSGGALFGLGFMFLPEQKDAYLLMGGIVIVGGLSCLLFNLDGHGGILFAPDAKKER